MTLALARVKSLAILSNLSTIQQITNWPSPLCISRDFCVFNPQYKRPARACQSQIFDRLYPEQMTIYLLPRYKRRKERLKKD